MNGFRAILSMMIRGFQTLKMSNTATEPKIRNKASKILLHSGTLKGQPIGFLTKNEFQSDQLKTFSYPSIISSTKTTSGGGSDHLMPWIK